MKHLNIRVSGRVQGVFFRASARDDAHKFNISGFVRNDVDGSVYIEAEGSEEDLEKFIEWCKTGPELAIVDQVEIEEGDWQGYEDFEVTR